MGGEEPGLPSEKLADLLPRLLDGAFEEPLWGGFLEALRDTTGADYASLSFRPPGKPLNALVRLYCGIPCPPEHERLYHEHLFELDPLPYNDLQPDRPYRLEELLTPGVPAHDAYYQQLLVPSGMTALRIMRVTEVSGVNAWLVVSRRAPDFEGADDALLTALAPYLSRALRSFVALERARFTGSLAEQAIRRLDFGWITLDRTGMVLDADPHAESVLTGSKILGLTSGRRLTVRPQALEREILEAVQALAKDPGARPRALILSREPWLDMLLVPAHGASIVAKPDPAVVAYINSDGWSSKDRCAQLADLFGLTQSEARLTLALSRGMNIAEAAAELRLTEQSARTYSKTIYAKLGARGQPDLVRFVSRSILAMA
jgi:DNA-binding CsgD family transcriptional regulator